MDVMSGFKLYITTKLPNPAYTPEVGSMAPQGGGVESDIASCPCMCVGQCPDFYNRLHSNHERFGGSASWTRDPEGEAGNVL